MENIRYKAWLQNQDKFATVYNCPKTENIGSMKFISGSAAWPDMHFIDPIFFRIRTIVHCVTNNMPPNYYTVVNIFN